MKKEIAFLIILSSCHYAISMGPHLVALQQWEYQSERYSNEPMRYLKTQTGLDIPRRLFEDGQKKYQEATQGWEGRWSTPPKPFDECTWNEIQDAYNGNSIKLANWSSHQNLN